MPAPVPPPVTIPEVITKALALRAKQLAVELSFSAMSHAENAILTRDPKAANTARLMSDMAAAMAGTVIAGNRIDPERLNLMARTILFSTSCNALGIGTNDRYRIATGLARRDDSKALMVRLGLSHLLSADGA